MKKLLKIGISFLKLLANNNPKVYWWSYKDENVVKKKENFGDYLNPYLVEKLTGRKPVFFSPSSKFAPFFKHSIMIGSVIDKARAKSIVWGSGIINENETIKGGDFIAVRGPRTAKRIEEQGLIAPKIYGDPGILISYLYNPIVKKKYEYGLVAHYVDFENLKRETSFLDNVLVINLLTNDIEEVINRILSCEKIISTSLHGIIVSHAYNIPTLWWKYSNKLSGDDIKFYDYYESIGFFDLDNHQKLNINQLLKSGNFRTPTIEVVKGIQDNLLNCFPYKIKKNRNANRV